MPCLNGFFFLFIFAVSNSRTLSNTLPRKKSSETYSESPVLDDWEQKLLGKKSVLPYSVPSAKSETLSLHNSSTHSSRSNTLERPNKSNKDSVIATHRLPTHEVNFIDTYLNTQ